VSRSIEEILSDVLIDEVRLSPPVIATAATTLEEAYGLLEQSRHGAVVVCEEDRVCGIFTERDVLYRTALEDLDPRTPLADLMTRDPFTLRLDARVSEAVTAMTHRGYRHVPLVSRSGSCVGLLASRDVLRFIGDHFPEAVLNLPPRLHQQILRPEGG